MRPIAGKAFGYYTMNYYNIYSVCVGKTGGVPKAVKGGKSNKT